MKKFALFLPTFFYSLLFFVPLILFPKTSELFEFNKMILVYLFTVLILSSWLVKMILAKKFLFRRTILDIPLIIFLAIITLSTLTSIDTRTSFFGYYSRFNGGLLSVISYSILYFAFVTNMTKKNTLKSIYILLFSSFLVSVYAILQHFGIDKDIWVQDVQSRVFSTLGQPNWLAAFLVALIPITWALALRISNYKLSLNKKSSWLWVILSGIFFLTLLYSGSRSGLLGLAVADMTFWGVLVFAVITTPSLRKNTIKTFTLVHLLIFIITLINGTQFTPSIREFFKQKDAPVTSRQSPVAPSTGTSLESGGTESGIIRQIVWEGAIDLWKDYPILGTGPETFAYAYYNVRPVEHNLVSEWQYLYNKAHNEYLNFAATIGSLGLIAYLLLIFAILTSFIKKIPKPKYQIPSKFQNSKSKITNNMTFDIWNLSLMSGFVSILITNFFGFSVVPVSLLFFLFPAMAIVIRESRSMNDQLGKKDISYTQKTGIGLVLILALYLIILISRYWYADLLYAQGKLENDSGNYIKAKERLEKAINISPKEAFYWEEISQANTQIALALLEEDGKELAENFANQAILESEKSVELSPANVNLKRTMASMYIKLSTLDINYLINARNALISATAQAPTDAQLFYNLGLAYIRTGEVEKAIDTLEKTIEMKKDYRNARLALAILLSETDKKKAKEQLEYILNFIDPDDPLAKQELAELEK